MAQGLMPPPLFTLESLVTLGQWSALQAGTRRRGTARRENKIEDKQSVPRLRQQKPARAEA
jgi:hypothetical protein